MTVETYIRRKNEIVKKATGVALVPEEQVEDIPDFTKKLSMVNDMSACPYCIEYSPYWGNCTICPMVKSGNKCMDYNSTYVEATRDTDGIVRNPNIRPKLKQLIKEFNDGR